MGYATVQCEQHHHEEKGFTYYLEAFMAVVNRERLQGGARISRLPQPHPERRGREQKFFLVGMPPV